MPDARRATAQEGLPLLALEKIEILDPQELNIERIGIGRIAPQRIGRQQRADPLLFVGVNI